MLLNNLSSFWKSEIFYYIRPIGIVRGIVSCYRKILDALANADSNPIDYPVGRGHMYATLELPLTAISTNVEVAGMGSNFVAKFPFMLVNAPRGIVRFGKAVSASGAELYADFIEYNGVYYFRIPPINYGNVDTHRNTVVFTVSRYDASQATTAGQNALNIYPAGTHGYANKLAHDIACTECATNGISGALDNLIGGITLPTADGSVVTTWEEGSQSFALLSTGELLRLGDTTQVEVTAVGNKLQTGESCRRRSNYMVISDPTTNNYDVVYREAHEGQRIPVSEYPGLQGIVRWSKEEPFVKYADLFDICSNFGKYTRDIGTALDDRTIQSYIDSRTNKTENYIISSFHNIAGKAVGNYAYVYLSPKEDSTEPPAYFPGISPDTVILRNVKNFSILRCPLVTHGDYTFIVVMPGKCFGTPITCNHRIHGISFVEASDEQNYRSDSILDHMEISNVPMHAGGCVVLAIKNNNPEV